jgi:mono/diheme cytochrome c family protein
LDEYVSMTQGTANNGIITMAVLLGLVVASDSRTEGRAPSASPVQGLASAQTSDVTPVASQRALIDQYCLGCHSDRARMGGLALSELNLDAVDQHAAVTEKVIRKLRGGLMPPPGARRPDSQSLAGLISWLENEIDTAVAHPRPGRVALRRINRREYAYAVRDLLGLNVDAAALLPADNVEGHFDTNADALQVSPSFVDQYIYAARVIALEAVGNPKAPAVTTTYGDVANMVISLPPRGAAGTGRQQHRLEGMPFGTRGGFSVEHNFPADGEYELTIGDMALAREVPRMEFENTVIALLDGHEFYRSTIGGEADHKAIDQLLDPAVEAINGRLRKIRFQATAGQHRLAVTFLHRGFAESDERIRTQALEGGQERIQAAHALQLRGPLLVTGVGDSIPRQKIFACQPSKAVDEAPCAEKIITTLARRAFRRAVSNEDVHPLMAIYAAGQAVGGFEAGVRDALGGILASPHFLYRAESGDEVGGTRTLSDLELASRLSFFLWSSLPDEELLDLATDSRLSEPDVLAGQVGRMLADPRAVSLVDDFAFQWLNLAKLDTITPDRGQFPHASGLLDPRDMLKEELRLFLDSVLRSDRSVVELLTADYTFLNERLAMHYGIETVKGSAFRRVTLDDGARHGLLGKGAILMLTAYPNRTSPVLRGAWILDRLLGAPPPDPPPGVPSLPENGRGQPARTVRERMQQHRASPTCAACHGVMDPLGLALENFNAVGQFRTHDSDTRTLIDTSGLLPSGEPIAGPEDLRGALVAEPDLFVQAFTENLLTYALGRRVDYRDMPTVRGIVRRAKADDYRFESLVLGIVSSDAFRRRETQSLSEAPVEQSAAGGF